MYRFQINLDDDKIQKNFNEDDQKGKSAFITSGNKDNDVRSKLNQILDKYRAPHLLEIKQETNNNELESILNNIENMINKNTINKPNELENYINNKDENNNNNVIHDNSQMSKLNVSNIKKNSIYNNFNNLDVSSNQINNNYNYKLPYNPYLYSIIEVDVYENLGLEVNKRNKLNFKIDYTSTFYVPDNYEIFVYDPFININFNCNLNNLNIDNLNNNRENYYKNVIQQQQNLNGRNFKNNIWINNNGFMEKLNTSKIDNSSNKNVNSINRNERENSNHKNKNEINYFINNEGEVEIENNSNSANFGINTNNINNNFNNINNAQNITNSRSLISFSSKRNDIKIENSNRKKQSLNINKKQSKNKFF